MADDSDRARRELAQQQSMARAGARDEAARLEREKAAATAAAGGPIPFDESPLEREQRLRQAEEAADAQLAAAIASSAEVDRQERIRLGAAERQEMINRGIQASPYASFVPRQPSPTAGAAAAVAAPLTVPQILQAIQGMSEHQQRELIEGALSQTSADNAEAIRIREQMNRGSRARQEELDRTRLEERRGYPQPLQQASIFAQQHPASFAGAPQHFPAMPESAASIAQSVMDVAQPQGRGALGSVPFSSSLSQMLDPTGRLGVQEMLSLSIDKASKAPKLMSQDQYPSWRTQFASFLRSLDCLGVMQYGSNYVTLPTLFPSTPADGDGTKKRRISS